MDWMRVEFHRGERVFMNGKNTFTVSIMLEWLYQWFVKIVSYVLSFFGVSMAERSVEGAVDSQQGGADNEPAVEVPSIYSMGSGMSDPQPMEA